MSLLLATSKSLAHDSHNRSLPMEPIYIPSNVTVDHGRVSVHGWLWLPDDTNHSTDGSTSEITGWFYHHTPEFGIYSPHDFEIMVCASLSLEKKVEGLPLPPATSMLSTEYVLTPSEFSLDELITGKKNRSYGKFSNDSFDTKRRYTLSNGTLHIRERTTIHYLWDLKDEPMSQQAYLSYPRHSGRVRKRLV